MGEAAKVKVRLQERLAWNQHDAMRTRILPRQEALFCQWGLKGHAVSPRCTSTLLSHVAILPAVVAARQKASVTSARTRSA